MKTKIIIGDGWKQIAEYDFIVPLSRDDYVEFLGVEYIVDFVMFYIEEKCLCIALKEN